ncbi:MAG: zf-HC2 domain-containing protein [Actinomycetota bacterium]|nr:zf-HC2 domain-containing protein [Actinomycetota bacterium]MDH4352491.1 zf-HC2 domain-containing protein [Actinomycetota bacterium]MDH5277471.1 zf-HC2 domain-containing protein [Actinomycetota bacterium]
MTWHITPELARSYADGSAAGAPSSSVEAHLLACDACRALVASEAPAGRLDAVWAEIQEQVDAPRPTWVERLLTRLGVSPADARLLSAAPSLQVSWLLGLVAVLAFAAAAASSDERGLRAFLLVAPLVPVIAVAGAYGRRIDPTYEVTRSTPYPTYRLLLLRVVAVLSVSVALTAVVSLFVGAGWMAMAWLLPSLAMVGVVLVLTRYVELPVAAGSVVAGYALAVTAMVPRNEVDVVALAESTQLVSLSVAVACLAVVVLSPARRAAFRRLP